MRSELGDHTTHWTQVLLDYARAIGCDDPQRAAGFVPTAADRTAAAMLAREHAARRRLCPAAPDARAVGASRALAGGGFHCARRSRCANATDSAASSPARPPTPRSRERSRARRRRRSRSPVRPRSALSPRWPNARATSSPWIRGRCTSRQPSAHRPSGSSRCSPTSPIAGRRVGPHVARRARRLSVPARAPQGDLPRFRVRRAISTVAAIVRAVFDGSRASTRIGPERETGLSMPRLTIQLCTYNRARLARARPRGVVRSDASRRRLRGRAGERRLAGRHATTSIERVRPLARCAFTSSSTAERAAWPKRATPGSRGAAASASASSTTTCCRRRSSPPNTWPATSATAT